MVLSFASGLLTAARALPFVRREFSAHSFVRITLCQNENRRNQSRPVSACTAIYARAAPLSRPIKRTYSAEVTGQNPQSPASSQTAPLTGALISYINTPVCVKDIFQIFVRFPAFSRPFPLGNLSRRQRCGQKAAAGTPAPAAETV